MYQFLQVIQSEEMYHTVKVRQKYKLYQVLQSKTI